MSQTAGFTDRCDMNTRLPRYTREDHARLGRDIYEHNVRSQVEAGNAGRIVAIDIEEGDFAVADSTLSASEALLAKRPDAQIWCVRIGSPAVHRLGSRWPLGIV